MQVLCKLCATRLADRRSYARHLRAKHPEARAEARWSCATCGADARDADELKAHALEAHGRPLRCAHCPRSYMTATGLKLHAQRRHGTATPRECERCGKTFRSTNGLAKHRRAAHERPDVAFHCDACGARFSQKINLRIHIERRHAAKTVRRPPAPSTVRPYACAICNKTFKTAKYMRSHRARHNAVGAHACATCAKTFASAAKLRDHANVHTGARPIACRFCTARFANAPNCLKHAQRMHPRESRKKNPEKGTAKMPKLDARENDLYPFENSPPHDFADFCRRWRDASDRIYLGGDCPFGYDVDLKREPKIETLSEEEELDLCYDYVKEEMSQWGM